MIHSEYSGVGVRPSVDQSLDKEPEHSSMHEAELREPCITNAAQHKELRQRCEEESCDRLMTSH